MTPNDQFETFINQLNGPWKSSLLHARASISAKYLTDEDLIELYINCEEMAQLSSIIRLLYQDSKERPIGPSGIQKIKDIVKASSFNLKEWIQAIYTFDIWLKDHERRTPFLVMLGYLQCCEDSPENINIKRKLSDLFLSMVNEFGFIGK